MNRAWLLIMLSAIYSATLAQKDTIQTRLVLIGDAGAFVKEAEGRHPVTDAVKKYVKLDKKTTVVFLGDNLYKEGLPDDQTLTYAQSKAVLDSQISVTRGTQAKIIFIPGNHDWNNGGPHGYEAIVRQQQYIDLLANASVSFFPREGCPGPVEIPVSKDVTLIVMDSQWWLHESDKPGVESDCPHKTKDEVLSELQDLLLRNASKLVIFGCHHPFKSYGIHGGYFTLKQHIFPFTDLRPNLYVPLPVIGSVYPITRGIFGTIQDLKHPDYQNMVTAVQKVIKTHPYVIYAAGHEHSMQLIRDSNYYYVISGSGCKQTRVSKGSNALFAEDHLGFATLEISTNRNVNINFYTVDEDSATVKLAYAQHLYNFRPSVKTIDDSITKATVLTPQFKDKIMAAPNTKFNQLKGFQRWLMGNNYRRDWATPIELKVFNIRTEKGGFTIDRLGGGKATKTLTLKDKQGREWVLRTINKDPSRAIPENFHKSIAEKIAQDFISGSYPYAGQVVPPLAQTLNVNVAHPELFFVPDDPEFGVYRNIFAHQIVMLEPRDPTEDRSDTKSSFKVFDKLLEDNDNHIEQTIALRARLLDILIADWDRHLDQWKFGVRDTGKGKLYYPIPRDRDQAFFYSDGFAIKALSHSLLPFFKGFRKDIPGVNWLAWSGRHFDRLFLNDLDLQDWQREIEAVRTGLTDAVIDSAVRKIPKEVYAISGPVLAQKLKSRKDLLLKKGLDYYRFLSRQVNVLGSNKKELFMVTPAGANIRIRVFKRNELSDSAALMYDRIFTRKITREVHLYGFNGNDIFYIDPEVRSAVKLRIIGGKGDDTFNIRGRLKNFIYDVSLDSNYIISKRRSTVTITPNPLNNQYELTGFEYNRNAFPTFHAGYNVEDRLMLGLGFSRRVYGFRKEPYASYQRLTSLFAVSRDAYRLRYQGEFNHVWKNRDILIDAQITEPVLNNFFGLGNETQNIHTIDFYRVRYKFATADVMLRRRPIPFLHLAIGPSFFHYWNRPEDNRDKILANPSVVGLDSLNVYSNKTYGGLKATMLIDYIDNAFLPRRGLYWNTEYAIYRGLNNRSNPISRIHTDMTVYGTVADPSAITGVLRIGAGHIFNKHFEYFQAMNLGQNNFLRGFRKNRFAGRSLVYGSLEARLKVFSSKSYLFPGDIGIIGFAETGRVWMPGEDSNQWHTSYGTGLYYSPFNLLIFSGTVAFSKEETLFNLSVGTRINLTF